MGEPGIRDGLWRGVRNTRVRGDELDHVRLAPRSGLRGTRQAVDLGYAEGIDDLGAGGPQLRECFLEVGENAWIRVFFGKDRAQHTQPRALERVFAECGGI